MDKYYVGARVISIHNHSRGRYKKGDIKEVQGIRKSQCKCGGIELDLGMATLFAPYNKIFCTKCLTYETTNGTLWQGTENWRIIDEDMSETTIDAILDEINQNSEHKITQI